MGDDGFRPAGQHGRHHPPALSNSPASRCIHTAENGVQTSRGNGAVHRVVTEPEVTQLLARHDSVLSLGKAGHPFGLSTRSPVPFPRYPR